MRAPGGCPWDRAQTPSTLTRYVLEEAYEVVDAIESADPGELREELGDLLLQVYLQAEIAQEAKRFDLNDVVRGISEKLIRRHPHVFGSQRVSTAEEVELSWAELKRAEKSHRTSVLDGIPRSQPALAAAQEVQRRLVSAGFDWPDRRGAIEKLEEELGELRAAWGARTATVGELGDVLFMLAKLATDAGLDAETALRGTIKRVQQRYRTVEQAAAESGSPVGSLSLERQLDLWESAKSQERDQA